MKRFVLINSLVLVVIIAQFIAAQPPPLITNEAARANHKFVLDGLPKLEDIESIVAEQTCGPPYGPEIAPFTVPKEFHRELMSYFEDSEIDTGPIFAMPEVGCLMIKTKDGKKSRICWYCGAQGAPTMFSVKGMRCVKKEWDVNRGEAGGHLVQLVRKIAPPQSVVPLSTPPGKDRF